MTASLSEDQIKNIAIRYLKEYYRYRPKTEKHIPYTLRDQKLEGDITVDVLLVFDPTNIMEQPLSREKTEEEKALELIRERTAAFIASCEATSRPVKEELYYRLDRSFWLWESLATALFITAGLFIYAETAADFFPDFMGFFLRPFENHLPLVLLRYAALFTGCFLVLIAWISLRWNKTNIRYRYIYAIRQFQAYSVNEQWIAFAEDVFTERNAQGEVLTNWKDNPYFHELHRQASKNGTGLLLITEKKEVIPLLTAAREQTGEDRRLHRKLLPKALSKTLTGSLDKVKSSKLASNIGQRTQFYRPVLIPFLLSLFFALTISFIIYQHWLQRPGPRKSSHTAELQNWKSRQESPYYLLETPYVDTPFWPVKLPFLFDSTQFIDPITLQIRKRKKKILPPLPPPVPSLSDTLPPPLSTIEQNPCAFLSSWKFPAIAIVYGIWPQEKDAQRVQNKLQLHGINAQILPAHCLDADFPLGEDDYLLILGTPLAHPQQAEKIKDQAEDYLRKDSLLQNPLLVITFTPKE